VRSIQMQGQKQQRLLLLAFQEFLVSPSLVPTLIHA
jgi:hypothetical protein